MDYLSTRKEIEQNTNEWLKLHEKGANKCSCEMYVVRAAEKRLLIFLDEFGALPKEFKEILKKLEQG